MALRARIWWVAVVVGLLGPLGCGDDDGGSSGPGALARSAFDHEVGIALPPVELGGVGLVGGPELVNDSDGDAVVEDVELVGRPDGMEVVGWVLMDHDAGGLGAVVEPFPPVGARPLGDGVVAPTRSRNQDGDLIGDVQVVIGLRLLEPGVHSSSSVVVTYADAGGRHTVEVNLSYTVCGPVEDVPTTCLEG